MKMWHMGIVSGVLPLLPGPVSRLLHCRCSHPSSNWFVVSRFPESARCWLMWIPMVACRAGGHLCHPCHDVPRVISNEPLLPGASPSSCSSQEVSHRQGSTGEKDGSHIYGPSGPPIPYTRIPCLAIGMPCHLVAVRLSLTAREGAWWHRCSRF